MTTKERLDLALVTRGLAQSRERAQATILSGEVYVNGLRADKASHMVLPEDQVEVRGAAHPYVSRGGLKLQKAIEAFSVDVQGVVAMDVGASTGGFTDVLLRAGAKKVYAVDVGYGQLDYRLRIDPRVVVMERTNARLLMPKDFPEPPSLAVMDVSFISIRLILPALFTILGGEGRIITLIKPQFEAGRDRVGKKGVVRDIETHRDVLAGILRFVEESGHSVLRADYSPIKGPEGNIEFLFDIKARGGVEAPLTQDDLFLLVQEAHKALAKGFQSL